MRVYSRMEIDNWNKENLMWLAGFLEGDGSFSIHKRLRLMRISAVSVDLDVLEKVREIVGYGNITFRGIIKSGWNPTWDWTLCKQDYAYALLIALYDFMSIRRKQQIKECMDLFKSKPSNPLKFKAFNEEKTLLEWSKNPKCIVAYKTLHLRLKRGLSIEEALTKKNHLRGNRNNENIH